jgi:formate hydrogenlyase transcriptional activator
MFFLQRFCKRIGKQIGGVSEETMRFLMRYAWPGNVRELQNVIERGVALARGSVLKLGADLLPLEDSAGHPPLKTKGSPYEDGVYSLGSSLLTLEEVERRHIMAALEKTDGVIEGSNGAATILDLHPNTLRSRMKKLGIDRAGPHEMS